MEHDLSGHLQRFWTFYAEPLLAHCRLHAPLTRAPPSFANEHPTIFDETYPVRIATRFKVRRDRLIWQQGLDRDSR